MFIIKNDNTKEEFNIDKINEKIEFACKGLKNVSPSQIAMNTKIKIQDGTKTKDIQMALVKSAAELISPETPEYDIVAARLLNQRLRKEVYKQYTPLPFYDEIVKRVKKGYYDKSILEKYTKEEIEYYGSKIKYELDEELNFLGISQLYYKYLIEYNSKRIETPQEVYMIMNMYIFMDDLDRKSKILNGYKFLSKKKVSFPTPVMNGLRTDFKKFISCNVMNTGDSRESLSKIVEKILMATASKSGIGINASKIRGLGADIDNGRMSHTGVLPIFKAFEACGASFSQSKIRGGAININTPWYHYETELICQLKDTRGTDETRTRHTDQTILLNDFFIKKALNKEDVYLFHMNEVPDLYENLGSERFEELYEEYSKKVSKKHKKLVNAFDLLSLYIFERSLTGRIYFGFANNDYNGSWKKPEYSKNLCCEITLPNTPLDGSEGIPEIASCILASINHGYVEDKEMPEVCEYLVNFLDNMIDYMSYDMEEVQYSSTKRRALGIGSSDLFHFLAKNKQFYNTKEGLEFIFNRQELMYHYLLKASNEIAKSKGKCELFEDSKYSEGWLAFKNKLNYFKIPLKLDWTSLEEDIKKFGLRNSTVSAHAPCSNSASLSNSTNGVEPPRELVSQVEDKNFKVTKLVPEYSKYKNYYTTSWGDDFNNSDYFKLLGIIQLFTDQAISSNQYSNALKYEDKKIPISELIKEIVLANQYGLKSLYYQNFLSTDNKDGLSEDSKEGCSSGGCSV
jgi:ribonucleoside-diphosphate reductase, alpha subunit